MKEHTAENLIKQAAETQQLLGPYLNLCVELHDVQGPTSDVSRVEQAVDEHAVVMSQTSQ